MSKKTSLIILLVVSFGVHFAFFGHPKETVFDEVHFGKFISSYYTHQYHFDIHPPGGKLIIAGFAKAFNFSPEYSFAQIGQKFPDNKYLLLRFLPNLAGALLPLVIFLLACELGIKRNASFLAGLLVALDNALLTQSRYILLDPFLLLFGFTALWLYFRHKNRGGWFSLILMSVFAGLAISIKWTGLSFLAVAGISELAHIIKYRGWKNIWKLFVFYFGIPLFVYFSIFTIHFSLLTKTGDGDGFMTPAFQSSLEGSYFATDTGLKPLNIFQKFIELNKEMYTANKSLTATHPYGSKWYTWPFMVRPIYYWNGSDVTGGGTERIYLIGNPIVWYASTIALLYSILSMFGRKINRNKIIIILLAGYTINLLPFMGIDRVMFLYHYLTAYILAILMLAYWFGKSTEDKEQNNIRTVIVIGLIAGLFFIYFAPLSYGLSISQSSFMNHVWLPSWQ
ncbi:MAG: phospholipid carrier-dependent glycosyltransferase [Candidatus Pacebacteria bacterium]|nr:phospholipid carrier-dependent glycosyltransferase [Candidatus Paceibacterota bacterium]